MSLTIALLPLAGKIKAPCCSIGLVFFSPSPTRPGHVKLYVHPTIRERNSCFIYLINNHYVFCCPPQRGRGSQRWFAIIFFSIYRVYLIKRCGRLIIFLFFAHLLVSVCARAHLDAPDGRFTGRCQRVREQTRVCAFGSSRRTSHKDDKPRESGDDDRRWKIKGVCTPGASRWAPQSWNLYGDPDDEDVPDRESFAVSSSADYICPLPTCILPLCFCPSVERTTAEMKLSPSHLVSSISLLLEDHFSLSLVMVTADRERPIRFWFSRHPIRGILIRRSPHFLLRRALDVASCGHLFRKFERHAVGSCLLPPRDY